MLMIRICTAQVAIRKRRSMMGTMLRVLFGRVRFTALVAACLLSLICAESKADTVYTSQSDFMAAISASTVITFDGIAPIDSFINYPAGVTLSGVTFTAGNTSLCIVDPGYYSAPYPSAFLNADFSAINTVTATFPSVTAIGFDFGGLAGPTGPFTLTLSDGFSTVVSNDLSILGSGSLGFVGITSSTPLTSITIMMPDVPNYNAIDNFTYGTANASPVPEPGSFALMATGLIGAVVTLRRRMASR
jgi:hypothetical protein